jgi:hypothetical protein
MQLFCGRTAVPPFHFGRTLLPSGPAQNPPLCVVAVAHLSMSDNWVFVVDPRRITNRASEMQISDLHRRRLLEGRGQGNVGRPKLGRSVRVDGVNRSWIS